MNLEKKQKYSNSFKIEARKQPDYNICELAGCWGGEIIRNMEDNDSHPGALEREKIRDDCFNRILSGIENGELEGMYLRTQTLRAFARLASF